MIRPQSVRSDSNMNNMNSSVMQSGDNLVNTWNRLQNALKSSTNEDSDINALGGGAVKKPSSKNLMGSTTLNNNKSIKALTRPTSGAQQIGAGKGNFPSVGSVQYEPSMQRPRSMYNRQPAYSTVSSVKSMLNLKAMSRPHSRPITATTNNVNVQFNHLNWISNEDFEKIKKESDTVHSLPVDVLLDLYTAKCTDNLVEYMPDQAVRFIDRFRQVSKHRKMDFCERGLGLESAKVLNGIIQRDTHFCGVNLDKNVFSNIGAIILADAIRVNSSLVSLSLCSNDIGPEGAQAIFGALIENQSIIMLNLSSKEGLNRNRLGTRGAEPLEWVLKKNDTLQILNLAGTSLGPTGLLSLVSGLEGNKSLVSLNISSNELGPSCAEHISKMLKTSCLLELNIANNKFTDQGLEILAPTFKNTTENTVLERLDLTNNNLSSWGITRLFEVLQKTLYLKKLILDDNNFAGKGLYSITGLLWENISLVYLSLNNCEIEPEGGESLGNGLSRNMHLQTLLLQNNRIKDFGGKAIAAGLQTNEKLKIIDLTKCKLGDASGIPLAQILKTHETLQQILLKENYFHDETGILLTEAARVNGRIKKITVDRNPIGYRIVTELNKAIEANMVIAGQKRYKNYSTKRVELKKYDGQKESILRESTTLEIRQQSATSELEQQKKVYQKEKEQERQKNEILEKQFNEVLDELRTLDKKKELGDIELKRDIVALEGQIQKVSDVLKINNSEYGVIENKIRLRRDQKSMMKFNFENQIDALRKLQESERKKSALALASYNSFLEQVNKIRSKIEIVEGEDGDEKPNRSPVRGKTTKKTIKSDISPIKGSLKQIPETEEVNVIKVEKGANPEKIKGGKKKKTAGPPRKNKNSNAEGDDKNKNEEIIVEEEEVEGQKKANESQNNAKEVEKKAKEGKKNAKEGEKNTKEVKSSRAKSAEPKRTKSKPPETKPDGDKK